MNDNWHSLEPVEAMIELDVKRSGLSDSEVTSRRLKYGDNKLAEPVRVPGWKRFLSQYNDPLNYLLIGAAIVALLIHPDEPGDAILSSWFDRKRLLRLLARRAKPEQTMESLKCLFRSVLLSETILMSKLRRKGWFPVTS